MSVLFLNGPPFSSSLFWAEVQNRLSHHNIQSHCFDFLQHSGKLSNIAQHTLAELRKHNIQHIVAHGLAVPLALQLTTMYPLEQVILSNGPLNPNSVLQFLSRCPSVVLRQLLRPTISIPFCASSIAFRRLVVNPYVMERDTIVSLCSENLSSRKYRNNTVEYLHSVQNFQPQHRNNNAHYVFLWGDADRLFPATTINTISLKKSTSETIFIAGGEHFHPIERPWAIADHIHRSIATRHACHSP